MPMGERRSMASLVVSMLLAVLAYPALAQSDMSGAPHAGAPAPAAPGPAPAPAGSTPAYAGSPGPGPAPGPASTLGGKHRLRITSVVNALAAILDGVKSEEVTETANFVVTKKMCENQTATLKAGYEDGKKDLKENEGKADAMMADSITTKIQIKKLKKDIDETEEMLLKGRAQRKKQKAEYTAELAEKKSSLHQLGRALTEISKVRKKGGFLQKSGVVQKLQMNQPGESSYIFGVMKNLRDGIERQKADLIKTEATRADIDEKLQKTQTMSISQDQDTMIAKTEKLSQLKVDMSTIQDSLAELKKKVPILLGRLTETAQSCAAQARAWNTKQTDRLKEKNAINQAIRFLQRTALEQIAVAAIQEPVAESGSSDGDWEQVFGSTSFLQLGLTVEDSEALTAALSGQDKESGEDKQIATFITAKASDNEAAVGNGLKKAVKMLIASHADNQKSDDIKKKYCDTTKESLVDQNGTMTRDVDSTSAKVDMSQIKIIQTQGKIDKLEKSMAKVKEDQIIAADVRAKTAAVFKQTSKDRKVTVKLLGKAMTVLKSVYKSFVQTDGPINGQGAVDLLLNIKDDILKEERDAALAESASKASFATEKQDAKESLIAQFKEQTQHKTTICVHKVNLLDQQLTLSQQTEKLQANMAELAVMDLKCKAFVQDYERVKKARFFDKGQLLDVIDIIADSDIGTRTVLAQAQGGPPAEQDAEAVVGPM